MFGCCTNSQVIDPTLFTCFLIRIVRKEMQPERSYLVCATPRSGSTLVCHALEETGVAGRPEEHFEALSHSGRRRPPPPPPPPVGPPTRSPFPVLAVGGGHHTKGQLRAKGCGGILNPF